MRTLLFTFFIFVCLIANSSLAMADKWSASQFKIEIGNVVSLDKTLVLASNPNGQILVSVPTKNASLLEHSRVSFEFAGPPPAQIYIIWQTNSSQELFQKSFRPLGKRDLSFQMKDVRGWNGEVSSLKFGFMVQPGQQIQLLTARIFEPGINEKIEDALSNWLNFRSWRAVDINVYTGTAEFSVGPYPARIFACITLFLTVIYLVFCRRKSKPQSLALIIFCSWLALDSFWQFRLWRQVNETRVQYAGKTSEAKVTSSEDAPFARLAAAAAKRITGPDARVFVAGMQDYQTMVSAYYLAPINTFWHRNGPELPDAKYLKSGDYIFLLRASATNYQPTLSTVQLASGDQFKVKELISDRLGTLLEVIE